MPLPSQPSSLSCRVYKPLLLVKVWHTSKCSPEDSPVDSPPPWKDEAKRQAEKLTYPTPVTPKLYTPLGNTIYHIQIHYFCIIYYKTCLLQLYVSLHELMFLIVIVLPHCNTVTISMKRPRVANEIGNFKLNSAIFRLYYSIQTATAILT